MNSGRICGRSGKQRCFGKAFEPEARFENPMEHRFSLIRIILAKDRGVGVLPGPFAESRMPVRRFGECNGRRPGGGDTDAK